MSYTQADIDEMNRYKTMSLEQQKAVLEALQTQNQVKSDELGLPAAKEAFETHYGVDQNRTPAQWRNLVKVYGIREVCKREGMINEQVIQRMEESFTAYYKRILKERRANV